MSVDGQIARLDDGARRLRYVTVALGVLASALFMAMAWLLSETVDRVFLGHQGLGHVSPLLWSMLVLAILRAGMVWSGEVVAQRGASRVKVVLRARLTQQLFALGPARAREERSGELVNTLVEGVEMLDEYVTQYQPARLLASIVPVLLLLVILALDPWTGLVLLFAGPMLVLLLAMIGARTKDLSVRRFRELSWMSAHFLDMVQGLATLKMFGRSKEQAVTIDEISQHFARTTMNVLRTAFQTSLMLEWAAVAATAFVALEVSLRLMHGLIPFTTALLVLLLTPEFFLPLRQLALKYHAGTAGRAAAQRILDFLDTPSVSALTASCPAAVEAHAVGPQRMDIDFSDVHFAYDGGQRPALRGFNLSIPHGQTVALVGPTGAGKSTVASLLLRFIEPTAGAISVAGAPLCSFDLTTWRSLVSWVSQHPHLFYGTIAENIRLARPVSTIEEIEAAARAAHADEFIRALPQGYDTPIHEGGTRLSGGQRQRIAIARAFLKDAPLLILDEATAHLDTETEALIQDALHLLMRGRTTLIIAHRLTMAYEADEIVVMDQGRVLESGTHRTLLATGSLYPTLVANYEEYEEAV
jgi:ATP-binding cassette subfamily C protein CydD